MKSNLNLGLSNKLKEAFPDVKPINKPEFIFKSIPHPWWVSGFTSGDGSFYIRIRKKNSNKDDDIIRKVYLCFAFTLHIREEKVLSGLVDYFKSLNFKEDLANYKKEISAGAEEELFQKIKNETITEIITPTEKTSKYVQIYEKKVEVKFSKFSDIYNIVIPFFDKYPILGIKSLNFLDFKSVAEIMKNKEHLTSEGFKKIELINSTMNLRRPWS